MEHSSINENLTYFIRLEVFELNEENMLMI